jgi:hypothetical protein
MLQELDKEEPGILDPSRTKLALKLEVGYFE